MATSPSVLRCSGLGALATGPAEADETCVYLHGWGGSKELWWNALAALAPEMRGIALDLPGTGKTPIPATMHTMPQMAEWVVETCARLGLKHITLIGHSLGGNLAAQVALDHPALVRRLVLVDAALEPRYFPRRAQWPLSPRYGLTALRLMRAAALPFGAAGSRIPHNHLGGFWGPYARRAHLYLNQNTDAAMQVQMRALCGNSLEPARLAALAIPILIVHGAQDSVVPVARARAAAAALPQARLVIFPTAHHCPMDADPPGFARTLSDFCHGSPLSIHAR